MTGVPQDMKYNSIASLRLFLPSLRHIFIKDNLLYPQFCLYDCDIFFGIILSNWWKQHLIIIEGVG